MARKLLLSVVFLFNASFSFSQTEVLKDVFNNLAFYNQKHDFKFLGEAKKAIDKTIQTKKDSANLYKGVYRAVVYSTIAYADSLNTLHMPDNFLSTTAVYADTLFTRKKIYNYAAEVTYIKRNIANVYIRKGFNDMQRNNYKSAVEFFQKAQALVPQEDHLGVYLAFAANKMGELNKAASYYDQILTNGKPDAELILTAQKTYKVLGDTAKALKALKTGRNLYPDNKKLLYEEANIYNNKKDYAALRTLIEGLVKANPDDYDINFLAGVCYDQLNQTKQAEVFYKKAIQLNRNAYDAVFNLGVLYMKKGLADPTNATENFNLAQLNLEKANEMNPNNPGFMETLKLLYDKTGDSTNSTKISTQLNQIIN
jgi:Flp pilus assembly protein TadD